MFRKLIYPLLLLISFSSCSKFSRVVKSTDINEKYDAAVKYYDEKDYYRAGILFEDIMPSFVGTEKAENVQFSYAYCHFNQDQYLMANHYFKNFYTTYNRSPYAEEALYMSAYSVYKDIPKHNLDQSNTTKAIDEMQDFMNRYPNSKYIDDANKVITELRANLEKKAYEVAMQYVKLRRYKAAAIALGNFNKDYPDSELREVVLFNKLDSEYNLAEVSIASKQEERYENAIETYEKFNTKFPTSDYSKNARKINEAAQKELERIRATKIQ